MSDTRRNLGWLWYFLGIAVLTVAATVILAVYNLSQQLRPEQLEAAQKAWREKGPADYVFSYTVKRDGPDTSSTDHFFVKVQGGKAREVLVNGLPQDADRFAYYGMPKLHDYIEGFLELDAKKGQPKTYTRAFFNPNNGALAWYVRRVMGVRQRVEITVETFEAK